MKLKQLVIISLVAAIVIPLTISSLIFSTSISKYLADKLESSDLPTALREVRNAVELELTNSIAASRGIANNSFVTKWLETGESEQERAEFVDYLEQIRLANNAANAYIVSGLSNNYYTQNGILTTLTSKDTWFTDFTDSHRDFEIAIDVDMATGSMVAYVNYIIKVNGQRSALGGVGRSLDGITELVKRYKIGESGVLY